MYVISDTAATRTLPVLSSTARTETFSSAAIKTKPVLPTATIKQPVSPPAIRKVPVFPSPFNRPALKQHLSPAPTEESFNLISFDDSDNEVSVFDTAMTEDEECVPNFNDTLEAMDYYMEKGKTMMAKKTKTPPLGSPKNKNSNHNSLYRTSIQRRILNNLGNMSPQNATDRK